MSWAMSVRFSATCLIALGGGCFKETADDAPMDSGDATSGSAGASTSAGTSSSGADATAGTTAFEDASSDGTMTGDTTDDGTTSAGVDCALPAASSWDEGFDRPDADVLGNCWIEKTPAVWQLVAGEVTSPGVGATMPRDHLVWRDGLVSADVEVKLEFRVRSPDPRNEPHVLARLTDDALQPGGAYHGYALLPRAAKGGTPMQLCMMRFDGAREPGEQRCENLPAPLEIGPTRHRLVLQVTGPGPVLIDGRLDVLHDGDQDWTPLLTLQQWQDTSPDQIVTAGTAGFSGGSVIDVLDNFAIEGVQIFTFG